ncbi:MAG TPA: tetraacyldisaccharide 4'-kinase [Bacteroidetes bacterium]|mgnify:CR=1 FL=1|nr:tetraacyldisaccharide 4'-kinase [Bacteroidota bacterium]
MPLFFIFACMNRKLPHTYRFLLPLSWVYGLVIWCRNFLYDVNLISSRAYPVPVISVGNITVGGTGKTPHIEYLIGLLHEKYRLAVLSRGYRRKTRRFMIGQADSSVSDIGDEARQIKNKFPEVTVAVDRKRTRGIERLLKQNPPPDVILLDDAFQHRRVKPGLNMLLIDCQRPISRDYLLPAGRLREHAMEKRRAHTILVTKCPEKMTPMERRILINDTRPYPYQKIFFSTFRYTDPVPVFPEDTEFPGKQVVKTEKYQILLVTGIANNRPLKKHVRGFQARFKELRFPDHHNYNLSDVKNIIAEFEKLPGNKKIILTTEKDAMRLKEKKFPEHIRQNMYYVPVEIAILFEKSRTFNRHILDYVRKNKRNSRLYTKQN